MKKFGGILLSVIVVYACQAAKEPDKDGTIRLINFNSLIYGDAKGLSQRHDNCRVMEVAYGDLNNDGQEEAAVVTWENHGGTGNIREGRIYTLVDGKPSLMTKFTGGDRADGGIHHVAIRQGQLQVERFGGTGGLCCPEWIETTPYRVRNDRLVPIGPAQRRKYVNTDKGAVEDIDHCE